MPSEPKNDTIERLRAELQAAREELDRYKYLWDLETKRAQKAEGEHWKANIELVDMRSELQAARDEADQLRSRTFFVSCPWCFEKLEQRALFAQIHHVVECGDLIKSDHDKMQASLATAQAEIERLKRDHINQMTELRFFERMKKNLQPPS